MLPFNEKNQRVGRCLVCPRDFFRTHMDSRMSVQLPFFSPNALFTVFACLCHENGFHFQDSPEHSVSESRCPKRFGGEVSFFPRAR